MAISHKDAAKVHKLAQITEELKKGHGCEVTRLTSLKSLCKDPAIANPFVTYLARKTVERVERGRGQVKRLPREKASRNRLLMGEAVGAMTRWLEDPRENRHQQLADLFHQIVTQQNEHRRIKWGSVRIINDADLLIVEYALQCVLNPHDAGQWAYQTARHYAERYDAHFGTGLVPASLPLVQDIVDFWYEILGIAVPHQESPTPVKKKPAKLTHRQGQFLAFIHLYWKLHRQAPSELDMVQFFRVTPPSVHSMVVRLHELGLIEREPGVARSIRVTIPENKIPPLQDADQLP